MSHQCSSHLLVLVFHAPVHRDGTSFVAQSDLLEWSVRTDVNSSLQCVRIGEKLEIEEKKKADEPSALREEGFLL